jgi:hypothetical protein
MFIDRSESGADHMLACYDYPYHWSNTENRIKHFLFTLPKDEKTNRHIFVFYLHPKAIKLPLLGPRLPHWLMQKMMRMTRTVTLEPLLGQDVWVLGHEQEGWEKFWDRPAPELSPVVREFQTLTIRKWEAYLERTRKTDDKRHLDVLAEGAAQ